MFFKNPELSMKALNPNKYDIPRFIAMFPREEREALEALKEAMDARWSEENIAKSGDGIPYLTDKAMIAAINACPKRFQYTIIHAINNCKLNDAIEDIPFHGCFPCTIL